MQEMRIGIVHNEPVLSDQAFYEASHDVLDQVEAVETVLQSLGYPTTRIPFTRDLNAFMQTMKDARVQLAFNLCETVDEDPHYAGHPAAVLELMGIPFTGSPPLALMLTTDKLMTKRILRGAGLRTPDYLVYDRCRSFQPGVLKYPVIAKPRYQDASIGIEQESVFKDTAKLLRGVEELYTSFGPLLVEEFIEGSEYNVSLFGYPKPRCLPVAELDFSEFPPDLFPIVGYKAKWDKNSFEYNHTPRIFPTDIPNGLAASIENIAAECFRLFMLRDYGRVDMRLDSHGRVHVLEVNANPCLSPDAGFAAAAEQAGMTYSEMTNQLLCFVMQRGVKYDYQSCEISG